jgi:hypothetical protein
MFWAVHCGIRTEIWVVIGRMNERKCRKAKEDRGAEKNRRLEADREM